MGLEVIGTVLSIGSAVMGVAQSMSQASQQQKLAQRQYQQQQEIAQRNYSLQTQEIERQQSEVSEIAQKQKAERIRVADQELGTLRVVAGETGSAGGTYAALVRELAFFEGMDLSTIEANRKRNIEKGQSEKEFARQGAMNTITIAKTQADVQVANANATKWGAIGTALRIGGNIVSTHAERDARSAAVAREKARMNPQRY